jgi:hypothetical protein
MSNKNRQHHTMFELHILLKHQRRRFLNDLQPIKMFNLDWHKKSQNITEYFRVHASSTFFKNKFLNLLEKSKNTHTDITGKVMPKPSKTCTDILGFVKIENLI